MKFLRMFSHTVVSALITLSTVFAYATTDISCNLDSIKEVGFDKSTFVGVGRVDMAVGFYTSTRGQYYRCNETEKQGAIEEAKKVAVDKCRDKKYLNCRITDQNPSQDDGGNNSSQGTCYASATATGERTPEAMTAETYKMLLCKRLNDCLLDNIDSFQDNREKLLLKIGYLNGCFKN